MNDENEIQNELQSLPPIETFVPKGIGKELLRQIDEYVAEVNEARDDTAGLSPEIVKHIEEQFLADRVRHSATIEGSTLDRRETLHVLTTGQIIEGKKRPSEEVKNLGHALKHAGEIIHVDKIRETDIKDIHRLLMEGLIDDAGSYRPMDVKITNAIYRPPEHLDVPRLVNELVSLVEEQEKSKSVHGFLLGVYVHWAIARIHPFVDGNGRMARVLQDLFFLRHNLVPSPIPFQKVDDYYESLQKADGGNPIPFVEFIANAKLESLQRYKAAIEESRVADNWIDALVATAGASVKATEHSLFLQYTQRIGEFRETMRKVFAALASRIPEINIRFKEFSGIDLAQFRELKTKGRSSRTWDFGIDVGYQGISVRFVFWHGLYQKQANDSEDVNDGPVLLVSIDENETYRNLIDADEQSISLRAIGVETGQTGLLRIRFDPVDDRHVFDHGQSPSVIARDFIQELLRSKLGIG